MPISKNSRAIEPRPDFDSHQLDIGDFLGGLIERGDTVVVCHTGNFVHKQEYTFLEVRHHQ